MACVARDRRAADPQRSRAQDRRRRAAVAPQRPRRRSMKLNGWRRLYLFVVACWFAILFAAFVMSAEAISDLPPALADACLATGGPAPTFQSASEAGACLMGVVSDRNAALWRSTVLRFLLVLPLYIVGAGVAWVRRGFAEQTFH